MWAQTHRDVMSATKILWGQILVIFAIVLATTWAATQWSA
jgi:type IV secretion system protein VirD4